MDKYLLQILKEVNTIIIPEIGALTIVNQTTGEIMFMSYLKFDDGKLANYIAEKEAMDLTDAKVLVAKYIREIQTKLDKGETYDMYQFGSFSKNSGGEITFKAWGKSAVSSSNEPEKDIEPEIIVPIVSPQIEAEVVSIENTELIEPEKPAEETEIEKLIEETTIPEPTIVPEPIKVVKQKETEESQEPLKTISEEEQWNDDLDVPPINHVKETIKKPILEKAKKDKIKKKRGVGFYLLTVFLLLLIGGGTYVGMNYNELKQHIPFLASTPEKEQALEETATEEVETASEEENEEMEATETDVVEETEAEDESASQVVETSPVSTSGLIIDKSLPIQIIAGAFTEESNATRKVETLKSNGSAAEIIGRYGGFYFVCIGSFNSMKEVKATKSTFESAGKYWVFQK